MTTFTIKVPTTFATKEEYLCWRTQWRADYKALSQQIRDIKFARWFEDSARHGVKMSEAQVQRHQAIAKANAGQYGFFPNHVLAQLRAKATAALAERRESRLKAQEQYLKAHPASSVPS